MNYIRKKKNPPHRLNTMEKIKIYLQNIYQDILFWLLCAPDILQQDGVVNTLWVRLVQVVCVCLVPLLDSHKHLVFICADYL